MMDGGEGGGWCQAATYSSNHFVDIFPFCLCVCLRLCVLSFVPSSHFSQFRICPFFCLHRSFFCLVSSFVLNYPYCSFPALFVSSFPPVFSVLRFFISVFLPSLFPLLSSVLTLYSLSSQTSGLLACFSS